ncbi:FAD1 flavin adenine dinucleotide synthetase [Chytriomyces hyalinus]|nr:FAD1 flavin adenine dinucleotide synthetase [Chytriomyces hyalinus]
MPESMQTSFTDTAAATEDARQIILDAVQQFGVDGLGISFNGGKDCTVMLHLLKLVLDSYPNNRNNLPRIPCLFVTVSDQFPEVDEFVDRMALSYNLDVFRTSLSMKEGLEAYLKAYPKVKAVLVGTRRTDPYSSNLKPFDPTDNGWPECVRVHPILDWSYTQIWDFLRSYSVDYCCLYDRGYTSLGGIHNTLPNPALRKNNGEFDPAYKLLNGDLERNGRIKRNPSTPLCVNSTSAQSLDQTHEKSR